MSVAFSDLTDALEAAVPAVGGFPTTAQYQTAVKSAVSDFNRRAGWPVRSSISVVANTASYALPDDFIKLIKWDNDFELQDDVSVQPGGQLVPLTSAYRKERYSITGRTVTLYPTPTYTMTRYFWYKAGHVLDGSSNYPNMTDEDQEIILLKARANAMRYMASSTAPDGWRYSVGDVTVDKSGQSKSLTTSAGSLDQEYLDAIAARIGPVGDRADYTAAEMSRYFDDF